MGIVEALTVVFITLKLAGVIDWSWTQVFVPMLLTIVVYAIIGIFLCIVVIYDRLFS